MDFAQPDKLFGGSIESSVLAVLSVADVELTGREVAVRVGRSPQAVLNALNSLVAEGIVDSRAAGRAKLYKVNRDHIAAPWIQGLSGLRQQLLQRIRDRIDSWKVPPVSAAVFGSVARGQAGSESDFDLFLVQPSATEQDVWDEQVTALSADITRWTGNDVRVLEFTEDDLPDAAGHEPVMKAILNEGIEVGGSFKAIREAARQ